MRSGHYIAERGTGLPPLSPRPILRASVLRRYAPIGANAISLDEIDHFTGRSKVYIKTNTICVARNAG